MKWVDKYFTRRDFLKAGALGAGALVLKPWLRWADMQAEWPDAERLGRVCVGKIDIRSRPSADAPSVGVVYEDAVLPWLREVVGEATVVSHSRRWGNTRWLYLRA